MEAVPKPTVVVPSAGTGTDGVLLLDDCRVTYGGIHRGYTTLGPRSISLSLSPYAVQHDESVTWPSSASSESMVS